MKRSSSSAARPRVAVIVPAAGSGARLALKTRKPFVLLRGEPIIVHTLRALGSCRAVDDIIVASESSCIKKLTRLIKKYHLNKVAAVVVGGNTRFESVRNCLLSLNPSFDIVVIHDGARPFIDERTIGESIKMAEQWGGCVVAVPENDTVKLVDGELFITRTLDRNTLYRAQTPQAFRYDIIKRAYASLDSVNVTDDAGLVERLGKKVRILEGSYRNIKITTREDLKMAESLL